MLQHLYRIYLAEDSNEANQAPGAFIAIHQQTPLAEFDRLVETFLEWGDEIFAFHDTGDRPNRAGSKASTGSYPSSHELS